MQRFVVRLKCEREMLLILEFVQNNLNKTLKKTSRPFEILVHNVLIIIKVLVYDLLIESCWELGRHICRNFWAHRAKTAYSIYVKAGKLAKEIRYLWPVIIMSKLLLLFFLRLFAAIAGVGYIHPDAFFQVHYEEKAVI